VPSSDTESSLLGQSARLRQRDLPRLTARTYQWDAESRLKSLDSGSAAVYAFFRIHFVGPRELRFHVSLQIVTLSLQAC
jgi:hypothetical protein